jgi:hypothetical protein
MAFPTDYDTPYHYMYADYLDPQLLPAQNKTPHPHPNKIMKDISDFL